MTAAQKTRWRVLIGAFLPGLLALAGAALLAHRSHARLRHESAERAATVDSGPRVATARVAPSPTVRVLSVIAEARPYATVTLYAKLSGYVRSILVDKGEAVKSGALLAIVESPETDQQYEAARETANNRRIEQKRARVLFAQGVLSEQEKIAAETNAQVAEAALAQAAAVRSYELLRAPFASTITARYVDPGALVQSATSAQVGAQPIVSLSTLDRLRVQAWVDQGGAAFVRVGDEVSITMDERPGTSLPAKVTRIAGELAPRTRSMLVEIEYDNRAHAIVPGGYLHVGLRVAVPSLPQIPADALVLQGTETFVPIVGDDGRVHFRKARVADSDGVVARLLEGAAVGENVALHLGATLPDGARVRPVPLASPSAIGGGRP